MSESHAALGFLFGALIMAGGMLGGAALLRVRARQRSRLKESTYECGEEPVGLAWMQFHARYYLVALVFVLFDVEAVFLFPWATQVRELGGAGVLAIVGFVAVLMLGWAYGVRKDALRWE
jgi:NADH:ubiquinone oxidoreductase subunit 3 (subunit A)